ncbi:MAG TPA: DUF4142 domain-containing protein [Gemmataceae bacterium]|nr:DUF4142 domain-containing protein [Gemmataceae bacterium]
MLKRCMALAAVAGVLLYAGAARSVAADEENRISDQQFVFQASAAGLAEVNLSMLAKDRAHSDDVKKFAQHMIDEHGKANKKLNQIADRERLRVAPSMDQKHEMLAARLSRLSGKDFDHAYANAMLQDHEQAVSLFEREAKDGQNKELKEYASKALPTLKDHLSMARKLAGHGEKGSAEADHGKHTGEKARTEESGHEKGSKEKGKTGSSKEENTGKSRSGSSDKDTNGSDRK